MGDEGVKVYHGCGDGGCIFGHPGGMHTNGGCKCMREMMSANRDIHEMHRIVNGIRAMRARALSAEALLRECAERLNAESSNHALGCASTRGNGSTLGSIAWGKCDCGLDDLLARVRECVK